MQRSLGTKRPDSISTKTALSLLAVVSLLVLVWAAFYIYQTFDYRRNSSVISGSTDTEAGLVDQERPTNNSLVTPPTIETESSSASLAAAPDYGNMTDSGLVAAYKKANKKDHRIVQEMKSHGWLGIRIVMSLKDAGWDMVRIENALFDAHWSDRRVNRTLDHIVVYSYTVDASVIRKIITQGNSTREVIVATTNLGWGDWRIANALAGLGWPAQRIVGVLLDAEWDPHRVVNALAEAHWSSEEILDAFEE